MLNLAGASVGVNGHCLDINDQWTQISGYERSEVIGAHLTRFIAAEYWDRLSESLHGDQEGAIEIALTRKDGSRIPVELHSYANETQGHPTHIIALRDLTEQKRAQEKISWLASFIEHTPTAIVELGMDCGVYYVNPTAARLFPSLEQRGLTHPWLAGLEQIAAQFCAGETQLAEREIACNGRIYNQVIYHVKELRRLRLYGRDITKSKQAEEALQASEDFNRSLVESSVDCIKTLDLEGKLLSMSASGQKLLEIADVQPYIGKCWVDLWQEEIRPQVRQAIAAARAGGTGRFQAFSPTPTGTPKWWDIILTPMHDADGRIQQLLSVARDITQHKVTEDALRQSEERFRTLADAIPQLVWIARPDGAVFWYNRRWYEYTGTNASQMERNGWQSVHDPTSLPTVMNNWRKSIALGQPFEMELPLRAADGEFHPFLTRVVPLEDHDGRVLRWFGTNTDITEIVAARETLARSRAELECLVAQRTTQLVEANTNLQNFAYTVAHDLRAPLRAVKGFSSMVLNSCGALAFEDHAHLQRVVRSADQMEQLLGDLLEYSEISQAELHLGPVNLGSAVAEALAMLEADIAAKRAVMTVPDRPPVVIGHSSTIVLLVNNLISNALKFTSPEVRPHVRIEAEEVGDMVRLSVLDNGIGIDPQDLPKIFHAFQRLHSQGKYPGSGLGLAIVRKGVERLGGRVGVESQPGRGSCFWLEFKRPA